MLKLPQSRGKLFLQASLTKTSSRTLKSFINHDENGNRLESVENKERNVKACKMIPRVGILKVKERKKVSWKPDLVETKWFQSAMPKNGRKKSVAQKKKVISQSWDFDDSDSDFENPRAASRRAKSKKYTLDESSDSDF